MTDYNAMYLVPLEAPTDALQYAIDRTAREVADKVLGEIRDKECCVIRMDEMQYDEPLTNMVVVHCRIDIDELVRCKDCRYYECGGLPCPLDFCESLGDDGFCSRGERREP